MNPNLCLRCMAGTVRGGVCDRCGKPPQKNNPDALPPGTILHGRYFLGSPLGIGGFGITYAALDLQQNARVAVKELFPGASVHRQPDTGYVLPKPGQADNFRLFQAAFQKEAKTLMALQGQLGVVRLYHAFGEHNTVYYVMELLEGEDLRGRLKRTGPMSWEEFAPKLRILLDGLERLHSAGLIHRDISPDNIFLTEEGGCCLIDFGSARAYQAVDHFTVHLKKCFAPLEQFFSQSKQGPWTDIYSMCVTAYYTLTGVLPPTAPSRRQQDTMVPLSKLCKNLPKGVAQALTQGMAIEPEDRIQSVGELRTSLFPTESPYGTQTGFSRHLHCLRGICAGKSWPLERGSFLRLGRLSGCDIHYPEGARGVSRSQCTLYITVEGKAFLRDENSSYGTYLITNGKVERLMPEQWFPVDGSVFGFGEQELFQIQ